MTIVVPTTSFTTPTAETSGTVGATFIDTVQVIEHAARRCGKQPSSLTPENLDMARNNLHLILSKLSNRGVNLWAVDEFQLSTVAGKSSYVLPTGTESILNIVKRTIDRVESTPAYGASSHGVLFELTPVRTFAFKLVAPLIARIQLEYFLEGIWVKYEDLEDVNLAPGWHWYTLNPAIACEGFRIRETSEKVLVAADMLVSLSDRDAPMSPMNRDTYTALPDKGSLGEPNNYFFDKQINPAINLWPVPNHDLYRLVLWRQRRIHDVGSFSQKLEIPERWFECVIWSLAKNMAFELPDVTELRINLCVTQEIAALQDAELGESDAAPMFMLPNIRGYTA